MVELNKVLEMIASADVVPDMSTFDPNKTFKENGIDSLDVMSVFLAVEEGLGIKFTEEEVNEVNSAVRLVEAINAR